MDPNSVLKIVREQKRQISDKFIKPNDHSIEMAEYKPNLSQLSPQQQLQYQQQIRQQYEAMAPTAGLLRQQQQQQQQHSAASMNHAVAMMNNQKKMMDEIYARAKSSDSLANSAAQAASAFNSKAFLQNGSNGEYSEAQYLASSQQRLLKSNMDMYHKLNAINSSPLGLMSAQQQQQQKLSQAYSLEFHKRPNNSFSKPGFYDATDAAHLSQQQQQQQLNPNSVDPRNKLYKKTNIPLNDFYLNTNGHLSAPNVNPANGSQQMAYNLQNAGQIDALTRSASVKSVASDSGIGSSSPLSDCSDYGNGANQNINSQVNAAKQQGSYQQALNSSNGSMMAHHKMSYHGKPNEMGDPSKGFNKLKRPYIEEQNFAQLPSNNNGQISPKLTTINNGSIVVPKPVMATQMAPNMRPKSNENNLDMNQSSNMAASASSMLASSAQFGPGRKRKNQPNVYDDMILANSNRINQQKLQGGKHEGVPQKDDALTTAAVAAAAAVLGYTSTMSQASTMNKQAALDLAKPKPINPQSSTYYSNASIVPAASSMVASTITKQINTSAMQSPYLAKNTAASGLIGMGQLHKDLNNNNNMTHPGAASKYACTDRCCSGGAGCTSGHGSSGASHHLHSPGATMYHADKASAGMTPFKTQSPLHSSYLGHEYGGHHHALSDGHRSVDNCCSTGSCTQSHHAASKFHHHQGVKQQPMIPSVNRMPTPTSYGHLGSPGPTKHEAALSKRHSISIDMNLSNVHEKLKEQQQQQPYCDCAECNYLTAAAAGQNYIAAAAAAAAASVMSAVNNGAGKPDSHESVHRHSQSPAQYLVSKHSSSSSSIPSPHLSSKSPQLRSESLHSMKPMIGTSNLSNRADFASPRLSGAEMLGHSAASFKHGQGGYALPHGVHPHYSAPHNNTASIDAALLQQKLPCPCKDCYNALKLKQQMPYHHHQSAAAAGNMSPDMRPPSQGISSPSPGIVKPKPVSLSASSSNLLESYLKDATFAKRSMTPSSAYMAAPGFSAVPPGSNRTLAKHMESFIDKAFKADKDMSAYFDLNGAAGKVFTPKMQGAQYGDLVKDGGLPITKQKNSFFSTPNQLASNEQVKSVEAAYEHAKRRSSKSSIDERTLIVIDNDENDNTSAKSSSGTNKRAFQAEEERGANDDGSPSQQSVNHSSSSEYYSRNNMNLLTQAKDATAHNVYAARNSVNGSPSPAPSPSSSTSSTLSSVSSSSSSVKRLRRSSDGEDKTGQDGQNSQEMETTSNGNDDENAAGEDSTDKTKDQAETRSSSTPVSQSSEDSSVSISKKTLPIVTSHIQDWLDKLFELSLKLSSKYSFDEIYEHLLKHSWSRLLLTYMIENSFQFFVTRDSHQQPQPIMSPVSLKSKILSEYEDKLTQEAAGESTTKTQPKEKEATQLQNLINKGYNLGLKADEFELLREMILFKEGGEESKFSEACAQAQRSLQEAIESNHGQQQFTKLLLFLPSIYNVKTEVVEALFCRHLNNYSSGLEYLEKKALEVLGDDHGAEASPVEP